MQLFRPFAKIFYCRFALAYSFSYYSLILGEKGKKAAWQPSPRVFHFQQFSIHDNQILQSL